MLKAKDIMTKELLTVTPKTEITKAAEILLEKGVNGLPVVDAGRLVGILCQSDLIAQQKKLPIPSLFTLLDGFIPLRSAKHFEKAFQKIAATTVADSMTPDPVTVQPETSIEEIAALMVDKNFHTLPVVKGAKLVGIIGKEDVLRTLMSNAEPSEMDALVAPMIDRTCCFLLAFLILPACAPTLTPVQQELLSKAIPTYEGQFSPIRVPFQIEYRPVTVTLAGHFAVHTSVRDKEEALSGELNGRLRVSPTGDSFLWEFKLENALMGDQKMTLDHLSADGIQGKEGQARSNQRS